MCAAWGSSRAWRRDKKTPTTHERAHTRTHSRSITQSLTHAAHSIVGRADILGAIFLMGGLLCFVRCVGKLPGLAQRQENTYNTRTRPLWFGVWACVHCARMGLAAFVRVCLAQHAEICTCTHTYTHAHTHTHAHTGPHAHTYTHAHTRARTHSIHVHIQLHTIHTHTQCLPSFSDSLAWSPKSPPSSRCPSMEYTSCAHCGRARGEGGSMGGQSMGWQRGREGYGSCRGPRDSWLGRCVSVCVLVCWRACVYGCVAVY